MPHRRLSALIAVALAAALSLLALPAGASAITVQHDSAQAVETTSGGDGLIGPGDTFSVDETLHTSDPGLTGVSGTLTSSTPGLTVTQGNSAWPDLLFGVPTTNAAPFQASLSDSADCGVNLGFAVHVHTDQGDAVVPFTVPSGTPGPFRSFTSVDVPKPINDFSSATSTFAVATPGRVKGLRVRIGRISHTYVGDLRIQLIAPDGTSVTLMDPDSARSGANLVDTVFDSAGSTPISAGSAPFTGTFAPAESLHKLDGHPQQGTWALKVSDVSPGDQGTLDNWGADVSFAVCSGDPVASFLATPNPVLPGQDVVLDASGSVDPNGSIDHYKWDLDNSGSFEVDTGSTPTITTTFGARGRYPVRLQVVDNEGHTSAVFTADVNVTQPPTASFLVLPPTTATGQPVTFDAAASSDPDGPIARYEWDVDGNGTFETDGGSSSTLSRTFASSGDFDVHLRVTDEDGATATTTRTVHVTNRAPTAAFTTPAPAIAGQPGTFNASTSSDPDGQVVDYAWDFDGDGTYETPGGSASSISHTFASSGTYVVGLRITDNDGGTATTTGTVHVGQPPLAALVVTPGSVVTGQPVAFDASGSVDPDGTVVSYAWDLDGNGSFETSSGSSPTVSRSYPNHGVFPVRVRVTDNDGAQGTASSVLTVSDPPPPPAPPPGGGSNSGGTDNGSGSGAGGGSSGGGGDGGGAGGGGASGPSAGGSPDPGSSGSASGGGGGGATALGPLRASLEGPAQQKAKDVAKSGIQITCATDRPATCALQAEVSAADAKRLGLRVPRGRNGKASTSGVRVGGATVNSGAAANLRLSSAVSKRLKARRGVTITVRGAVSASDGSTASVARAIAVR